MRSRYRLGLAVLNIIALLILAIRSVIAAQPTTMQQHRLLMPFVVQSGSVSQPVLPPQDEASRRITVPPGFAIRIFTEGLSTPRLMAIAPDGSLYVAERGAGRVTRLPDAIHDGLADSKQTVSTGHNGPHSVEWHGDALYVGENDKISKLTDINGDGDFLDTSEKTTITTNIPSGGGHSTRTAHVGPDGKLYVSAGSTSDIEPETDKRRATIMRFNLDGSIPADNPFANDADPNRRSVWAEGLRNSVDFLWTPQGELWADHNGSDWLGDDKPPEEIIIAVQRGKSHGWPYCYTPTVGVTPRGTAEVHDERVPLPDDFSCDEAVPALFTDAAHSAPLGMTLGAGPNFPPAYHDDLFVAYHGSWNTSNVGNYRDCKVQRIIIENGVPVGSETFATGWRAAGQRCSDAWGRPADVVFAPDGSLYISDDDAGRVYRVVYVGP